ncbi:MAG: molecular chaperone DnaJ, partial [Pseudonocardiales bacterium]|nr:molecular chaperone DnaJ [Pseudonocardiales bacterium]
MCNPRRVRVRATRQLAQAWQHEVRRSATRIGTAVGEAR